jgi:hypothetical protein
MRKYTRLVVALLTFAGLVATPTASVSASRPRQPDTLEGTWSATFQCVPSCVPTTPARYYKVRSVVTRLTLQLATTQPDRTHQVLVYTGAIRILKPATYSDYRVPIEIHAVRDPVYGVIVHTDYSALSLVFDGQRWHGGGI